MTARATAAWEALNQRQQRYLSAIFDADQAAEARIDGLRRQWVKPPPAAEWRWVLFAIKASADLVGYTPIQKGLRAAGEHDPGAGSSLAALRRRGLIETRTTTVQTPIGPLPGIEVKLTTAGRAAARAGLDQPAPRRLPRGLLSEWLWAAVVKLYVAGDDGMALQPAGRVPAGQRPPSWNALLQLRDRRDGAFMEEYTAQPGTDRPSWMRESRVRISAAGRAHYQLHHACYQDLYPDIDAPAPAAPAAGAHQGLADHKARRPRGLVGAPDWRLLVALARLERTDTCYIRSHLAGRFQRAGRPVPADVAGIPDGLLMWQVRRLTRSEAVVDRLRSHPAGPLVDVVQIPNYEPISESPTWPLMCLTAAGRAHYDTHLADYVKLYPEINVQPHPD